MTLMWPYRSVRLSICVCSKSCVRVLDVSVSTYLCGVVESLLATKYIFLEHRVQRRTSVSAINVSVMATVSHASARKLTYDTRFFLSGWSYFTLTELHRMMFPPAKAHCICISSMFSPTPPKTYSPACHFPIGVRDQTFVALRRCLVADVIGGTLTTKRIWTPGIYCRRINKSTDQSINQSVSQSVNQSIYFRHRDQGRAVDPGRLGDIDPWKYAGVRAGSILSVESNQNVESKTKNVESKTEKYGVQNSIWSVDSQENH